MSGPFCFMCSTQPTLNTLDRLLVEVALAEGLKDYG
jgi:hypothetical protein